MFVLHPYPHGTPTTLHPAVSEILSAFEEWTTPQEAAKALDHLTPDTVADAVAALVEAGVLLAEDDPRAARDDEIARHWSTWSPEASFFHYTTQDVYDGLEQATSARTAGEEHEGQEGQEGPAAVGVFTGYPDAPRVLLPRPPADLSVPYGQVLYARRTVRDFTDSPVPLDVLATLLAASFGPVHFIDCGLGALYLRTSPQGGARQELDVYVGVRNVTGVAPGWYHYNGLQHSLELLTEGLSRDEAAHLCADQEWAGAASFLVVLAARLERMSVKYPTPRCYRVSLLNAGHLGQTFALTATALGLGPAQTGAFRDSALAERCTLDNTGHTPLYVLAAGPPHPEPTEAPPTATVGTFDVTRLVTPGGRRPPGG